MLALFQDHQFLHAALRSNHEFLASVSEIEVDFVVNPRIPCSVSSVSEIEVDFVVNPRIPCSVSSVSEIEVGFVVNPRIPCSVPSVPEVEVEFVVNPLNSNLWFRHFVIHLFSRCNIANCLF